MNVYIYPNVRLNCDVVMMKSYLEVTYRIADDAISVSCQMEEAIVKTECYHFIFHAVRRLDLY